MARSSARCSPCQNLYDGKDELASGTLTECSNCCTFAPAATRAPTLTVVPVIAPLVTSGSTDFFVVRYLKDDFQRILRTVLDFRALHLFRPPSSPPLYTKKAHVSGL